MVYASGLGITLVLKKIIRKKQKDSIKAELC